jgi:hypothetical protein
MKPPLPPPMPDNAETPEPFSLKRWSRRKQAAARADALEPTPPPASTAEVPATATRAVAGSTPAASPEAVPLPPLDSLTFESDYSAFMQPKIAEETRRAALRKLFSDPSFNVMDGLDIYVGDYTQSDPMPSGMLEKLSTVYAMLDPVPAAQDERPAGGQPPPTADATTAPEPKAPDDVAAASTPATDHTAPDADPARDPDPKAREA